MPWPQKEPEWLLIRPCCGWDVPTDVWFKLGSIRLGHSLWCPRRAAG